MDISQYKVNKNDKVTVDFSSELMDNYFPEQVIESQGDIQSVLLAPEQPALFCLNKDHKLQALIRKEASSSGWEQFILSEKQVSHFDISYYPKEEAFRISKVEDNRIVVSKPITTSEAANNDWQNLLKWDTHPVPGSEKVNLISLGENTIFYATTSKGKDAKYYLINLDNHEQSDYSLPENGAEVLEIKLGKIDGDEGVFLLYKVGMDQSMIFQSFPDPIYHKTTKHRFNSGEIINTFSLLPDEEGNHILFTGGNQIHRFKSESGGGKIPKNTLTRKLPHSITKMVAGSHGEEQTIWFLLEKGLFYISNQNYKQEKGGFEKGNWTAPLQLVEEAEKFTCIKGKEVVNQLFSLKKNGNQNIIHHLWQDGATSMWANKTLAVTVEGAVQKVKSYTVHIKFSCDKLDKIFSGQKVSIKADSQYFIYIDNKSYLIGPERSANIQLEDLPEITLTCPVEDLGISTLLLEADFLPSPLSINMAEKVMNNLNGKIENGNGLREARKPNGDYLIGKDVADNDVKNVEHAIKDLVSVSANPKNGMLQTKPGAKSSFTIPQKRGINLNQNQYAAQALTAGNHLSLGDFLYGVWHKIEEAVQFTIETLKEGVRIVVKIAGEVYNWIARTLREITGFIQKIFESIKVFFKDIFEFLAFLFDWEAIVETKNALKGFTNNAISSIKGELGNIKSYIDQTLDKEIAKFSPELLEMPSNIKNMDLDRKDQSSNSNQGADPKGNWLNSKRHFFKSGKEGKQGDIPTEFVQIMESFVQKIMPHVQAIGTGILKELDIIQQAFKEVIDGKIAFVDFLEILAKKLAGLGLHTAKQIIDILLESLEALIDVAQYGLNKAWNIPLISDIYKKISGNAEMSFLDVACLLIAIPTTILYKIGEGEAPFAQTDKKAFIDSGSTIFKLNL